MTPQAKLRETLARLPIPSREIECYGRQIVVTAHSREAAEQWAHALGDFATVRGITESRDDVRGGSHLCPKTVRVWRTFARIESEAPC